MDKLKNTSFRFFEDSSTASPLTGIMWSYEYKQSFNVDPNNPNNESQKNLTNNKNSSGLTKGAIAGIALLAQQLQNKRHNLNSLFLYFMSH